MQTRYNGEVIGSTKSKLILNMLTFFSPGEHETKMDSECSEKKICISIRIRLYGKPRKISKRRQ